MALSQEYVDIIKSTVPAIGESRSEIALKFYNTLFERYPAVQNHFNIDRQKGGNSIASGMPAQVAALSSAVLAYAKNIDKVETLMPVVRRIAHKHVSRGVQTVQYDYIGECLLFAMKDILGDQFTDETMAAWTDAYGALRDVFLATEKELRHELETKAGYSGMTEMKVTKISQSEDDGKLISLHPVNVPTPPHQPKMFVSIHIPLSDNGETMTSMKIVSDNEDDMTINVPASDEMASQYLLNEVAVDSVLKVSVPCGDL